MLCTKSTGTGVVVLKALGNDVDVNIPTETFKVGVVYYIYLKELIDDDGNGVEFIGYQYQSHPFAF